MTTEAMLAERGSSAEEFLAHEYEQRGTDYCDDKARALRQGDRSGFVRTDIAIGAIAAALRARAAMNRTRIERNGDD